ncbi:NUDIX hydrolase [Verrucomicrobiales bacterium BCK34]|nr:NUDIX hydrolase [Verrucomicrobiales bacterium BCK34]
MKSSPDQTNPWKTHETRLAYENPWIKVTESDVTTPGGTPGIYGIVHFKNRAIGVIPVDSDGNTWLVGQFRYALNTYEWEIPEGGCPEGESYLDAAKRELQEETGIVASDYELLADNIALSNSVCNERATIYVARGLTFRRAAPEDTEELAVRKLPLTEAIAMALDGTITDSMSVIGLLKMAIEDRQVPAR